MKVRRKKVVTTTKPFLVATDTEVLMNGSGNMSMRSTHYDLSFVYAHPTCAHCGAPIHPDVTHWARARINMVTGRQDQAVWCDRHGPNGPPWERPDPPLIQWQFEPFR